ncbi:hypothetical protein SAM9427_21530 [Streptomyces sp. ETH9427]|uniref:hypothetical protein n=1 Tax=Streptomyces sp. E1N211 TaxID=1851876 RepID=UPI000E0C6C36|nr:hypothetical protein [Streptomyces sp. E1N211]AXI88089.1 hypothetical protein SAM9427_21530 [Streptomyces sp. ETH9427]
MKRRTLSTAAAFAAAAALLLTACGGGNDGSADSDEIAGASRQSEQPSKSAEPGTSQEDRPDGVDLSLPKDINLVFDWDRPEDANEAAAMDDAANFFRAIYRGVDKRTAKEAGVVAYATGEGLRYAQTQVNAWIDGGWTATGTLRHYDATTRSAGDGTSVEVAFCADSGKFFGKEVKTGKVLTTKPSIEDFDYYEIIMVKIPTSDALWQASKVFVETKAAKCQ